MSEVFLCETGQLNGVAKRDLRKAGIVVVEVPDPSRCQFLRASEVVSGDDMLWAAMNALTGQESISAARHALVFNVAQLIDTAARARWKRNAG